MQEKETLAANTAEEPIAQAAEEAEKITAQPETAEETQAKKPEPEPEEEPEPPVHKKLFTLNYNLPLEDYLEFYRIMNTENVTKNKKKMTIMGAIELVIGTVLVVFSLMGTIETTPISWILLAVIFLLGLRSLFYYKFFYDKALVKAVTKEYNKLDYLRQNMDVDFYPNKCVEHVQGKNVETFWHTIHSVKESKGLVLIMLEVRRCLLIPKSQLGEKSGQLYALIEEICENFEKPRYEV